MKTRIISAFLACGKTHIFENSTEFGNVLDINTDKFRWIDYDSEINIENPEFPGNCIQHIKNNIGKVDYIFVSSQPDILDALHLSGLSWGLVMPHKSLLNEWIGRCYRRESSTSYTLNLLIQGWDALSSITHPLPNATTWLRSNEYLSDAMSFMSNVTPNTRKIG